MNTLYNISTNLRYILKAIDDNDGVISDELEQELSIKQQELEEKGISYGFAIKHFADNVDKIDAEIERLKALKQRNEAMADKIKDKIKCAMVEFNVEKIETATLKLSLRTSKETIIENAEALPTQFLVRKETFTPDKKAIKKAIEDGEDVTGAYVRENKTLQIK